jgi:hypothetical protein
MALYNSEAISGYPTGNLSSVLLNKIGPDHIRFVSEIDFFVYFIDIFLDTIQ